MSAIETGMISQLLTPEVMAAVDPALAMLGLEPLDRAQGSFTGSDTWIEMFGSTSGPFKGVGGAAMTDFRLTILHSEAAMILFAKSERFGRARLFGVVPYDEAVLTGRDWAAFTFVPLH